MVDAAPDDEVISDCVAFSVFIKKARGRTVSAEEWNNCERGFGEFVSFVRQRV